MPLYWRLGSTSDSIIDSDGNFIGFADSVEWANIIIREHNKAVDAYLQSVNHAD